MTITTGPYKQNTSPTLLNERGVWKQDQPEGPKQGGTKDASLDHYGTETVSALFKRQNPSLFQWDNLPEWKAEMKLLLPQEFRDWDNSVQAESTHKDRNVFDATQLNPWVMGPAFGYLNFYMHNYLGCNPWWKAPWRFPAWAGIWTAVAVWTNYERNRFNYEHRKSRLMVNNYYNRVRGLILDRERRKHGDGHVFRDMALFHSMVEGRSLPREKIWEFEELYPR